MLPDKLNLQKRRAERKRTDRSLEKFSSGGSAFGDAQKYTVEETHIFGSTCNRSGLG